MSVISSIMMSPFVGSGGEAGRTGSVIFPYMVAMAAPVTTHLDKVVNHLLRGKMDLAIPATGYFLNKLGAGSSTGAVGGLDPEVMYYVVVPVGGNDEALVAGNYQTAGGTKAVQEEVVRQLKIFVASNGADEQILETYETVVPYSLEWGNIVNINRIDQFYNGENNPQDFIVRADRVYPLGDMFRHGGKLVRILGDTAPAILETLCLNHPLVGEIGEDGTLFYPGSDGE